jgi:signal recognition particle GTPase
MRVSCRSVDLLRSVLAARDAGAVYSIVFVGINGVGKHSCTLTPLHTNSVRDCHISALLYELRCVL